MAAVGVEPVADQSPSEPGANARRLAALRGLPVAPWSAVSGRAVGAIVGLVVLRACLYAAQGAGFFLDDFHFVHDTQANGWFGSVQGGHKLASRPGMWLHFNVIYGLAGDHPLVLFAIVTVLNVVAAVLLYAVLARLLSARTALAVTIVWVAVANHSTITVWGAASQALLSVLLLLAGILLVTDGRWLPAALCLAASVLCYQVTIPLAVLAALLVPSARPLTEAARLRIVAAVGLATLWLITHPTYPSSLRLPNPVVLWSAHFGTGLFGSVGPPPALRWGVAGVVLAGVIVCLVSFVRGDRGRTGGPALVVGGLAVLVLGLVYLVSTPAWVSVGDYGWVDRLYAASSVGSAMVLVGIGQFVWHRQRAVAVAGGVALGLLCVYGQMTALGSWSRAGQDVVALMDELGQASDTPSDTSFAVGPALPSRNGVYALETVSATYALYLAHGEGTSVVEIANTESEFEFLVSEGATPVEWPAFLDLPDDEIPTLGSIGIVGQGADGVYLNGWAVRPGSKGPAAVAILVDGGSEPYAVIDPADRPREDVALVRGFGPDHGFDQVVTGEPLAPGEHSVCVHILDVPEHRADLGCRALSVRADPVAQLLTAEPVDGGVHVTGWALDPMTGEQTRVVASVDGGTEVDLGPATIEQGAVPQLYLGYGLERGFDAVVPATPGPHEVCVTAVRSDGLRSPERVCLATPG